MVRSKSQSDCKRLQTFTNDYFRLQTDIIVYHTAFVPFALYVGFMITLEPLWHRDSLCIAIHGKLTEKCKQAILNFQGRLYSATHRCFYVLFTPERRVQLAVLLEPFGAVESGWDKLVAGPMRAALMKSLITLPPDYEATLVRMRYSEATCNNYIIQFRAFLIYLHPKGCEDITEAAIHQYMVYLINERRVSLSTQNQAINAIKFYLEHVLKGERRIYYEERPRGEKRLPTVLSEAEVMALLAQTVNMKHRSLLLVMYSSGMRISELVNLKLTDIDVSRNVIYVRGGKGKKDRITLLSKVSHDYLMHYLEQYRPETWVFEGPYRTPYSKRSINKIIKRSARLAGIVKNVSAHTLRHSFATHLLERGTDLRYIQSLLGHESSRTTERYAHVTKKGFEQLVSPLDWIASKVLLEGNRDI